MDRVYHKSPVVRLLLTALAAYADSTGRSFPSITDLARRIDRSYERTRALLRMLERMGLVQRSARFDDRTGRQTSNGYQLTLDLTPGYAMRDRAYALDDDSDGGGGYGESGGGGRHGSTLIQKNQCNDAARAALAAPPAGATAPRLAPGGTVRKEASQGEIDWSKASSWWPWKRRRAMGLVRGAWVQASDREREVGAVVRTVAKVADHESSFLAGLLQPAPAMGVR